MMLGQLDSHFQSNKIGLLPHAMYIVYLKVDSTFENKNWNDKTFRRKYRDSFLWPQISQKIFRYDTKSISNKIKQI